MNLDEWLVASFRSLGKVYFVGNSKACEILLFRFKIYATDAIMSYCVYVLLVLLRMWLIL